MIHTVLIQWQPGSEGARRFGSVTVLRTEDEQDFDASAPYGYTKMSCRSLVVDGRVYPLHESTPDAGYAVTELWTRDRHEEAEEAEEAVLMSLSEDQRAFLRPGYVPVADRRAKRAAEDAAAEERLIAKRAAAQAEAAKAKA
jgi:hypothetical protein